MQATDPRAPASTQELRCRPRARRIACPQVPPLPACSASHTGAAPAARSRTLTQIASVWITISSGQPSVRRQIVRSTASDAARSAPVPAARTADRRTGQAQQRNGACPAQLARQTDRASRCTISSSPSITRSERTGRQRAKPCEAGTAGRSISVQARSGRTLRSVPSSPRKALHGETGIGTAERRSRNIREVNTKPQCDRAAHPCTQARAGPHPASRRSQGSDHRRNGPADRQRGCTTIPARTLLHGPRDRSAFTSTPASCNAAQNGARSPASPSTSNAAFNVAPSSRRARITACQRTAATCACTARSPCSRSPRSSGERQHVKPALQREHRIVPVGHRESHQCRHHAVGQPEGSTFSAQCRAMPVAAIMASAQRRPAASSASAVPERDTQFLDRVHHVRRQQQVERASAAKRWRDRCLAQGPACFRRLPLQTCASASRLKRLETYAEDVLAHCRQHRQQHRRLRHQCRRRCASTRIGLSPHQASSVAHGAVLRLVQRPRAGRHIAYIAMPHRSRRQARKQQGQRIEMSPQISSGQRRTAAPEQRQLDPQRRIVQDSWPGGARSDAPGRRLRVHRGIPSFSAGQPQQVTEQPAARAGTTPSRSAQLASLVASQGVPAHRHEVAARTIRMRPAPRLPPAALAIGVSFDAIQ